MGVKAQNTACVNAHIVRSRLVPPTRFADGSLAAAHSPHAENSEVFSLPPLRIDGPDSTDRRPAFRRTGARGMLDVLARLWALRKDTGAAASFTATLLLEPPGPTGPAWAPQ